VTTTKFRLVTRSDFDGLVCGVLLKEMSLIDEIAFVHPKDMQDGKIAISARDITANLPYVAGCHLAFDHHSSEVERGGARSPENHIIDADASSAARVVYRYFGGRSQFSRIGEDITGAVDKADSARFTSAEILRPSASRSSTGARRSTSAPSASAMAAADTSRRELVRSRTIARRRRRLN